MTSRNCFAASWVPALALLMCAQVADAGMNPVIPNPKFDPDAKVVALFDGLMDGQFAAKIVHKDEKSGNLFIANKTSEALTVELPETFVGIHVLNQQGLLSQNNNQFGQSGQGQSQGQGQRTGGGAQSQGNSQFGQGSGQNLFSIPPERIVRIPINTVCLDHGKPTPAPRMEYAVAPVETVTKDPVLKELLTIVAQDQVSKNVTQALAWHLSNRKSWQELAAMRHRQLGGFKTGVPLFTRRELQQSINLLEFTRKRAAERKSRTPASRPAENSDELRTGRVVSQR